MTHRAHAEASAPAWVRRGTGAFILPHDRVIVGLGSVRGIRNAALARSIAEGRSRVALNKLVELFAAVLSERVLAESDVRNRTETAPEDAKARLEVTIKVVMAASLAEVKTDARWVDPLRHGVYVQARLELAELLQALRETPPDSLAPQVISQLIKEAEWAHTQVARQRETKLEPLAGETSSEASSDVPDTATQALPNAAP